MGNPTVSMSRVLQLCFRQALLRTLPAKRFTQSRTHASSSRNPGLHTVSTSRLRHAWHARNCCWVPLLPVSLYGNITTILEVPYYGCQQADK